MLRQSRPPGTAVIVATTMIFDLVMLTKVSPSTREESLLLYPQFL